MVDGFTGIVRVTDLDDFIAPSQECVKPILDAGKSTEEGLVGRRQNKRRTEEPVSVSLNDCLACSGCVTSAETVLIQQQSHKLLRQHLLEKRETVVVSISPQAKASLAAKFRISYADLSSKLSYALRNLGVDYVFDTTFSRNFSLLASQLEFLRRWEEAQRLGREKRLPVLSSICPGWICYVEKSQGKVGLDYLSRVRSPMAIMGALVKDYLAKRLGKNPAEMYHVSVMPCYDKKLEASRSELTVPGTALRETDCVISTGELAQLLEEESIHLPTLPATFDKNCWLSGSELGEGGATSHDGSGSGGYAEHVFRFAASRLFGDNPSEQLTFRTIRNKDFQEVTLEKEGETVLRMGIVNGFRNIQNIIQQLKRNKCKYDYVEVMACPSGCLNGGGQIPAESKAQRIELLDKVLQLYSSQFAGRPEDCPRTQEIIADWLNGSLESEEANRFLFTDFHVLESLQSAVKW